jgi:cytochrome b561
MLRSDTQQWGSVAKFFHWAIVLLIVVQGTIGLIMVDLPKRPAVIPLYDFHKSLGLTILALALLRLAWRAFDARPRDPADMPRWQVRAARLGHATLYGLLFAVPLSGWWFDSVTGLRPLTWFGWIPVPHLGAANPGAKAFAAELHETLFWLLVAVASGHATMALVHHFHHRDEVLRRMWPGARRSHEPPAF